MGVAAEVKARGGLQEETEPRHEFKKISTGPLSSHTPLYLLGLSHKGISDDCCIQIQEDVIPSCCIQMQKDGDN